MSLTNGTDYVFLPNIQLSQQSMTATMVNGFAVCTPSFVCVIPEGAVGSVFVANVFTKYFPGQDARGGVGQLLAEAPDIGTVESRLQELLGGDKRTDMVFPLDQLEKFKVHTWWFNMVTLKRPDKAVNRLVIKGKEHKAAFKGYYAERLGLAAAA